MLEINDLWQEHQTLFWWVATGSVIMFFVSLFAMPLLILRLPYTYLRHTNLDPYQALTQTNHPIIKLVLKLLKNAAGVVFIILGVLMLVFPGQGILTIIVGLIMLDFPGKRKLVHRILSHPRILKPVNKLRRRAGKKPFE